MTSGPAICVIGAANVDLAGHSDQSLKEGQSNPGQLHVSWGGVARNIAENLARLGQTVELITVLGDDHFGTQLGQDAIACGIDLRADIIAGGTTPAYLSINDADGELAVAVAAMNLLDQLTIEWVDQHASIVRNAGLCVLDANLSPELIGSLLDRFPEQDFCVDAVSIAKASRLKTWLGRFTIIKLNQAEASWLSGIEISGQDNLLEAARYFLDTGIKQVFISLGSDGLFYSDAQQHGWLRSNQHVEVRSSSGAGDAMLAAIALAWRRDQGPERAAFQAMACALLTVRQRAAVNPELSEMAVQQAREQIRHA